MVTTRWKSTTRRKAAYTTFTMWVNTDQTGVSQSLRSWSSTLLLLTTQTRVSYRHTNFARRLKSDIYFIIVPLMWLSVWVVEIFRLIILATKDLRNLAQSDYKVVFKLNDDVWGWWWQSYFRSMCLCCWSTPQMTLWSISHFWPSHAHSQVFALFSKSCN